VSHESGGLTRSRRDLEAARLLASSGFHAQAVSRAYFAAFLAAVEALLALGEARSKHSGVIAAFGLLVVREGGFDQARGALLQKLFERRIDADYVPGEISTEEAADTIRDAERFVDAVQAWLGARPA